MMKKIELMEMVIDSVKQLAEPNDAPMLYFKDNKGKLIVTLLADGIQEGKKYKTCLAIKALKEMSQCKEMIMVTEAWMANHNKENPNLEPSKDPLHLIPLSQFCDSKCANEGLIKMLKEIEK